MRSPPSRGARRAPATDAKARLTSYRRVPVLYQIPPTVWYCTVLYCTRLVSDLFLWIYNILYRYTVYLMDIGDGQFVKVGVESGLENRHSRAVVPSSVFAGHDCSGVE